VEGGALLLVASFLNGDRPQLNAGSRDAHWFWLASSIEIEMSTSSMRCRDRFSPILPYTILIGVCIRAIALPELLMQSLVEAWYANSTIIYESNGVSKFRVVVVSSFGCIETFGSEKRLSL
jgi:hypothetical protein